MQQYNHLTEGSAELFNKRGEQGPTIKQWEKKQSEIIALADVFQLVSHTIHPIIHYLTLFVPSGVRDLLGAYLQHTQGSNSLGSASGVGLGGIIWTSLTPCFLPIRPVPTVTPRCSSR